MESTPLLQRPKSGLTTLIIIALVLSGLFLYLEPRGTKSSEVPLSTFIEQVKLGDVSAIVLTDNKINVTLKDGKEVYTIKEGGQNINDILGDVSPETVSKIKIQVEDTESNSFWMNLLVSVVPFLLIVGFFLFMFRQAQQSNNQALSFGKSRARLFDKETGKRTTFADVAGAEEAKMELIEVVDFLKNPAKYQAMGAKIPKGVLLIGMPGCGKTLIARAVAGEANVPFFNISGSEFVEMFVGVGASRVRDLFHRAKRNAPCIIFIDEIDAVGRQRGAGLGGGHDEREQTLNQILTEMDGFETDTNLIVMAASVTGDTPVLVKYPDNNYALKPIADVIDPYYGDGEENIEKNANGIHVLGLEQRLRKDSKKTKLTYFGGSAFKPVRSVFRHKTKEIYTIRFSGGSIRTTGNHSVFVRTKQGLCAKRVDTLQPGEYLADIPYIANRTQSGKREIRAHTFPASYIKKLPIYMEDEMEELKYQYAMALQGEVSQAAIANTIGVSQTTISKWHTTPRMPRFLSHEYFKHELPQEVSVTPKLCRLLGYYVAEWYARKEVDFCFARNETSYQQDVKDLMYVSFGIRPDAEREHTPNAVNIIYYAKPLADFFKRHCGEGAHNKHIPEFLFEAPQEHFVEFFRGYFHGDGYQDKRGRIELTSVSKRLLVELQWLSRMHGFKSYMRSLKIPAGRTINGGKPLPETLAWRLGFGKTQNPLGRATGKQSVERAKILKIEKQPFDGYVYDFCGCENEAFFGGEVPLLLHNTNRPDVLDPALLRPGRFDRRVVVDQPDIKDREAILKVHAKTKPLARDVDFAKVARQTSGFVGADLENLMNEAALLAARHNKKKIGMKEIEHSIEKVLLGPERKSKVMSKKEKEITAFHEVGHALVAHLSPGCDPVHKVSIISRGMALGVTWFMPEEDKHLYSKSKFVAELASLLGGYVAEELTFGHENITTGASNDLEKATDIARKMVTMYGMSELGPVIYGDRHREVFLGRDFGHVRNYSEEISSKIDSEIHRLIDDAYKHAKDILTKWNKKLGEIAAVLLEKETLSREEFAAFFVSESGVPQLVPVEQNVIARRPKADEAI